MRHIRNTMHFSLCAILIAVATVCGYHGIGHGKEIRQESKYTPEIDSLLREHDKCVRGESLSDSAIVYTISALQLADSVYGFESKEYAEIFTDCMIADMKLSRKVIVNHIYPIVIEKFNPHTEGIWRTYYKLGLIMDQFEENEKAWKLFDLAYNTAVNKADCIRAEIRACIAQQRISGGNIEEMLQSPFTEARKLDSPDREELLFLCLRYIVKYHIASGNDDLALKFINIGEELSDFVSSHDMLLLLRDKYDIVIKNDHIAAMDCLEKAMELTASSDADKNDKDWMAMALVDRGDYALNELVNVNEAFNYYREALNQISSYMSETNEVFQAVCRRMMHILNMGGEYSQSIQLGRMLVESSLKQGASETNMNYILELADAYISAGELDEASNLISEHRNALYSYPQVKEKTQLCEGNIKLLSADYNGSISTLDELLQSNPRKDVRLWAERYLAKAFSCIGDKRMSIASDIVNSTAKNIIARQLWLISPKQRRNWLQFCNEAIKQQLSFSNNQQAVKNAAELNLFKKSLLFRTSKQIENIVSAIPGASDDIARLHSLQRECEAASSKGDSVNYQTLFKEKDRLEQQIVSRYVENDKFLDLIDVKIDDVISILPADCAAIDFFSKKTHGKTETGAFVYSKDMAIRYVPILNYMDSLPSNAIESIWEKLMPLVGKYPALYFSTDGPINDMAIEYAQLPDGTNISDKIKIHRLFHFSEIKATDNALGHVAFVGVSDHNSPVETGQNVTRGNWTDLQNVELELNSLKNRISPKSLTVLYNNDATEKQFMALDGSDITALHITTHGVYRNVGSLEESAQTPSSDDYHIARRLIKIGKESLSALILREGNLNWHKDAITSDYDDLLTAEEIELMNFPNLQLTVLSACDTGLGEVDSEGVWGLQRVFRIAGTKSLICSLSKVDDYWTAQFMDAFYEQAAKGNTVYDSFHTAQRWLRHELPDNPEIWSSFILIE